MKEIKFTISNGPQTLVTDAFTFSCGPDCYDGFASTTGTDTFNKVDLPETETVQVSNYITNSKGASCITNCELRSDSDLTTAYTDPFSMFAFTGQSSFMFTCNNPLTPVNLLIHCDNYIEEVQSQLITFTCELPNPDCSTALIPVAGAQTSYFEAINTP